MLAKALAFLLTCTLGEVLALCYIRAIGVCKDIHLSMTAPSTPLPKMQKIEAIKARSNYLHDPLKDELENDEIYLSADAVIVMKYHGSYQQDNRDQRQKGVEKSYQFMLRLKSPAGEVTPELFLKLDSISDKFGQGDLRITTRQAFQIHGVMKGDLKTVISSIMEAGSSTVGACGDVSRNVMCSPAPFTSSPYQHARHYSKVFAELFKPQSSAVTELWSGEDKVVNMEYWMKDLVNAGVDIQSEIRRDTGNGIILSDRVEPLYGQRYLPKKFKIAITVPGDNSIDIYTNDIGLVVITDRHSGALEGFNVMVGGGMGRTHNKESTFARAADHLGFIPKEDVIELCKSILAAQRDHGNREVRTNARMKYLVHTLGIDGFRRLVEGYLGKPIAPWRELPQWGYVDWMGWHAQGDGKWFLGVNIQQGRVRDYDNAATEPVTGSSMASLRGVRVRSALRQIVQELNLTMVLSPTQSILFKDIAPAQRSRVEEILRAHGVLQIAEVDPLVRLSMACPALPLCGLAVTEAERRMPQWVENTRRLMDRLDLGVSQDAVPQVETSNAPRDPSMGSDLLTASPFRDGASAAGDAATGTATPLAGDASSNQNQNQNQNQIMMRMTGCPNGCARPYMAELALVGDGPDLYQIWAGGSPQLTHVASVYKNKVKWAEVDREIEPLLVSWRDNRKPGEAFGDYCGRVGMEALAAFSVQYNNR